jgi:hypothetical protein
VELPLGDRRQIRDFQDRLNDVVTQIPYDGEDKFAAEQYLEQLTSFIVDSTEQINNTYRRHQQRDHFKDGLSPEFLIHKWHLQAIIEIRRHLLGKKGRNRWPSLRDRQRDLRLIFATLKQRVLGLGLSKAKVTSTLTETKKGPEWWITQDMITADHCDTEIKALKQLMHGRKRSDMRRKW